MEQVSETLGLTAVGGDGNTQYNKNQVNGGTARKLVMAQIWEVGHNGDGFEVGKCVIIWWQPARLTARQM